MPSISDLSNLAQGTYAPAVIATLTLIIMSSALNVRALYSGIFERFFNTFVKESSVSAASENHGTQRNHEALLRIGLLLFLVLAWPSFFYSIGNLSPVNFSYDEEISYLTSDTHSLGLIACTRGYLETPLNAARFVMFNAIDSDKVSSLADYTEMKRALVAGTFARSMLCLFVFSFIVAALKPKLRQINIGSLVVSVTIILFLFISSYLTGVQGLESRALSNTTSVASGIAQTDIESIPSGCLSSFEKNAARYIRPPVTVRIGWPSMIDLLPTSN
jgi:hypothetical protein